MVFQKVIKIHSFYIILTSITWNNHFFILSLLKDKDFYGNIIE